MPDENDELNEMLEKYLGPAEAGEKLALEAAANHLSHEFNPPTKYDSGGMWFRNFYIPKSLLRYEPALAGVILPEVALVDLDPKRVAAKFREKFLDGEKFGIDKRAEVLAGLPQVIDWLVRFEQALRDEDGDEEVEVEA